MAQKPTEKAAGTITTGIGVLSGGEVVALEAVGSDLFLTVNRQKNSAPKTDGKRYEDLDTREARLDGARCQRPIQPPDQPANPALLTMADRYVDGLRKAGMLEE